MLPQTLGAVLALLLLVGPGFAFTLVRERRRPSEDQSGFREIAESTLTGLLVSGTVLVILLVIGSIWEGLLPDAKAWMLRGSTYVANHLPEVALFLAAWGVLSISSGALAARLKYRGDGPRIERKTNVWFELFSGKIIVPPDATPMVRVRLTTGAEYIGMLSFYDDAPQSERSLVLGPPLQLRANADADLAVLPNEGAWSKVLIPATEIESIWVRFVTKK